MALHLKGFSALLSPSWNSPFLNNLGLRDSELTDCGWSLSTGSFQDPRWFSCPAKVGTDWSSLRGSAKWVVCETSRGLRWWRDHFQLGDQRAFLGEGKAWVKFMGRNRTCIVTVWWEWAPYGPNSRILWLEMLPTASSSLSQLSYAPISQWSPIEHFLYKDIESMKDNIMDVATSWFWEEKGKVSMF